MYGAINITNICNCIIPFLALSYYEKPLKLHQQNPQYFVITCIYSVVFILNKEHNVLPVDRIRDTVNI